MGRNSHKTKSCRLMNSLLMLWVYSFAGSC